MYDGLFDVLHDALCSMFSEGHWLCSLFTERFACCSQYKQKNNFSLTFFPGLVWRQRLCHLQNFLLYSHGQKDIGEQTTTIMDSGIVDNAFVF